MLTSPDATPPIDLSRPDVTEEEIAEVTAVLHTNRLALGPKLAQFERAVACYVGCRHAVAVNSGTSALHLIVRALGLGDGDEVITTPFSFIASANCLLYERAVPRFVDIDPVTLNIDCDRVAAAITPRTRALLAVDVFGRPAQWDRLQAIAREHRLALIEDSCEALGARYRRADGRWAMAGSLADAGAFAFYPNKQITTGEGGIIVTDRDDIAALCRSMRNQGRDEGADWLSHARLGYNYRLPEASAALGLAQMRRLDEVLAARRQVAAWYQDLLAGVEGVETQTDTPGAETSWFVYVVRLLRCRSRADLGRVITALRARGIGCNNYFPPIHLQPFYRQQLGCREGDFPETERVSCQTLALPFYNRLTRPQLAYVVRSLQEVLAAELRPGGAPLPQPAAGPLRRAA